MNAFPLLESLPSCVLSKAMLVLLVGLVFAARGAVIPQGANVSPKGDRLEVTTECLRLNGRALVPMMGEMHFARVPRTEWSDSLRRMKEGGISIVSSYVFWNHHEWRRGEYRFDGNRDLAGFLKEIGGQDLWCVLRIGPWCHGEVREGGLPDWMIDLQEEGTCKLRTDSPVFLREVRRFWTRLAEEIRPYLWKNGGPVIGIQLENESRDSWAYYRVLKQLAVELGFDVPLYTRTGWAEPEGREPAFGETIPLYGGYAAGFWDRTLEAMPADYLSAFKMSPKRTSDEIATDHFGVRTTEDGDSAGQYPYFTCELGGGMASSYHRRLRMEPEDAFALTVVKLGSGSNLPGYYVYHGGTNPTDCGVSMGESQRDRYTACNDLPAVSYEFMSPLSQFGEPQGAYWMIRSLADFCRRHGAEFAVEKPVFRDAHETRRGRFVFHNEYVRRLNPDGDCWVGIERDGAVERVLDMKALLAANPKTPVFPRTGCKLKKIREAGAVPPVRLGAAGVATPPDECAWTNAAVYEVVADDRRGILEIPYEGDMARLYADGVLVQDDFQKGRPFQYALWRLPAGPVRLVFKVLPWADNAAERIFVDHGSATEGGDAFGDARWLWPRELGLVTNSVVEFRRPFVSRAETGVGVSIAADTAYAIRLNGRFVHAGRFPDVPPQRYFDSLPLEGVRVGTNDLEISLYVQGVDSFQTIPGDPGLIFSVRGAAGPVESGTGTLWRVSTRDRSENVPRTTRQLGFSFEHDAAAAESAWREIAPDDARRNADDFRFERRPVPRVEILPARKSSVVAEGILDGSPVPREAARGMDATKVTVTARGQVLEPDGQSVKRECFERGFHLLLDLGREEAGFLSLDVDTDAGAVIDLGYAEHAEDGRIQAYVGGRHFAGRYQARQGRQSFLRWSQRMAGRYVQLHVRGVKTHFRLHEATLRPAELPLKERMPPAGLSALQKRIWDTSVRTLRLCMHEHYEDCPWREQALYGNDARNQMLCGYYAFDEGNRMPELALQLHARGLGDDGWLEMCMPARIPITIPSFTLCWVLSVDDNLKHRGHADFTRQLMPTVVRILDARLAELRDGLLPCPVGDRYWQFYEWSDGLDGSFRCSDGTPVGQDAENVVRRGDCRYESPLNLFLILALEAGARCADRTDDKAAANRWTRTADGLRKAVRDRFWNPRALQVEFSPDRAGKGSEFVQALALLAGAVPEHRRETVVRKLMRRSDWTEITLSQTFYKYEALCAAGGAAKDSVIPAIDAEWAKMLDAGATSFWEMREGWPAFDKAGSLCHGWSAVPIYFYANR